MTARIDLRRLSPADAPELSARLRSARLACFPTDTVYGVGGAATEAVARELIAAKGRDPAKPLQVVFPSLRLLEAEVDLAPALRAACRALLPGPVTLVLPYPAGWRSPPPGRTAEPGVSEGVATLGVRVPGWPAPARAMAALELPLVASSANRSGQAPAASLDEVDAGLLARCDLVLEAGRVGGAPSSVVDLSGYAKTGRWRLLRAGAWPEEEIAARLAAAEEAM